MNTLREHLYKPLVFGIGGVADICAPDIGTCDVGAKGGRPDPGGNEPALVPCGGVLVGDGLFTMPA